VDIVFIVSWVGVVGRTGILAARGRRAYA